MCRRQGRLDRAPAASRTAPATAAGQARDDDVEQGDDAGDDGLQDGADAVDDGHQAGADGLEDGLDLLEEERVSDGISRKLGLVEVQGHADGEE